MRELETADIESVSGGNPGAAVAVAFYVWYEYGGGKQWLQELAK